MWLANCLILGISIYIAIFRLDLDKEMENINNVIWYVQRFRLL